MHIYCKVLCRLNPQFTEKQKDTFDEFQILKKSNMLCIIKKEIFILLFLKHNINSFPIIMTSQNYKL